MQVFQSWADIVIMLVLAIAYIVTYIAQRNQIKALRETCESHAELTQSQSIHINTFKNLFKPDELESFIKMKIDIGLGESEKTQQELDKENEMILEAYMETTLTLYMILRNLDDMNGDIERHNFIERFCPKIKGLTLPVFKILDQKFDKALADIKNTPN